VVVLRLRQRATQEHKYALGLNSCGSAIYLSLLCAGVVPGTGEKASAIGSAIGFSIMDDTAK